MRAEMLRRYKYPIEYELNPSEIDLGTNWVTLKLKNMGSKTLQELDIQLHSLDTYNLTVYGTGLFGGGHYLPDLRPSEEKEMVFRVTAVGSAKVYVTIKARRDGIYFTWESGWTNIKISGEKAEAHFFYEGAVLKNESEQYNKKYWNFLQAKYEKVWAEMRKE